MEVNLKRLEPRIPRTLSQEIYLIIHESLINAARHATASAVRRLSPVIMTTLSPRSCMAAMAEGARIATKQFWKS